MIFLDSRVGSKDLARPLQSLGADVSLTTMEFGDIWICGSGPGDVNVDIGIERKVISDLLASIETGRLMGHQIPGLVTAYEYPYLLVEGICRPGSHGILEVPRRGSWAPAGFGRRTWLYGDLIRFLNTVVIQAGVPVIRTSGRGETAQALHALAEWWDKPWSAHKSLKAIHGTAAPRMLLTKPSVTQTVAAQIPGVGWEYSSAVEEAFGSVQGMVEGSVQAWAAVRGEGLTRAGRRRPKLGETRAVRIRAALRGE